MFSESAELYDLIYDEFKDYEGETQKVVDLLRERHPGAKSVLDVGCGTGRHAVLLSEAHSYQVDGLDLNSDFVAIAQARSPGGSFTRGDMADFDLGRRYDVILSLFSAIGYVQTLDRVESTARCLAEHLEPDGLAIIEPWFTPDEYTGGRVFMSTVDQPKLKIVRTGTSVVENGISRLSFHYLVATPDGTRHLEETHELGLFTTEEMTRALESGGLEIIEHDPEGLIGRGMYITKRRSL